MPGVACPQRPIVKGDALSVSIAAASIVAKVARDAMMRECDRVPRATGSPTTWATASDDHRQALRRMGPSESTAAPSTAPSVALLRVAGLAVAKINPVKLKQDADKLEKAGKLDQAIALYRQIVDDNPRDWNTSRRSGTSTPLNKMGAASGVREGRRLLRQGRLPPEGHRDLEEDQQADAIALEPYVNLADLYAKQGLLMEAKSQYQSSSTST